jgi:hypothetical protein
MRRKLLPCIALWSCLLVVLSAPSLAQGGDGGEIISQFLGTSLGPELPPNTGPIPPDMGGSVGTNQMGQEQVVQMLNGSFTVYSGAGTVLNRTTDSTFWLNAGVPANIVGTGLSDPRIIYDPNSQRWFASEISIGNGTGSGSNLNQILIGVSKTSDPTQGFSAVYIPSTSGTFGDFPTLGVTPNSVVIGTNNFSSNSGEEGLTGATGVSIFSVPKSDLLAATPTVANIASFNNLPFTSQGWAPEAATNFGASPNATVLGVVSPSPSYPVTITSSQITGGGGAGAMLGPVTNSPMMNGGQPNDGRQPDPAFSIAAGDNRISSGPFQVGNNIYFAQSVLNNPGTDDVVQWGILDATTGKVSEQGIIAVPNQDLLYPSISANANGDFVVAFNASGPNQNVSAYYDVCSPIGVTISCIAPQLDFAGLVGDYMLHDQNGVVRWGDYSWTVIDPLNPLDFWLFQEYPLSSERWGTVITEIALVSLAPEPASLLVMATGLAGLGILRRRRRRASGSPTGRQP